MVVYDNQSSLFSLKIKKVCYLVSKNVCVSLGNTPAFSNLDASVSFKDDTAINSLMYTVTATDADTTDVITVTMTTSTTAFSFDATSGLKDLIIRQIFFV